MENWSHLFHNHVASVKGSLSQEAAALDGVWPFVLERPDLGRVRSMTGVWFWALQEEKSRFSWKSQEGQGELADVKDREQNSHCFLGMWTWQRILRANLSILLWRVLSECSHILKVEMTTSRIPFARYVYSAWTRSRPAPLAKLVSLYLSFLICKTEPTCTGLMELGECLQSISK